MNDYVVAYANDSTDYEWQPIGKSDNLYSAIHHFNSIKLDFPKSSLAVFCIKDGTWRNHRPYRIYNQHILIKALNPNMLISSAVSGIINSRESDWF